MNSGLTEQQPENTTQKPKLEKPKPEKVSTQTSFKASVSLTRSARELLDAIRPSHVSQVGVPQ
jgi:hypothetical protein